VLALLLFLDVATGAPPPALPARATVRIERSTSVRAEEWIKEPREGAQRRELKRTDTDGRPILIRVIEHP
jgi:hypothetical protein